MVNQLQINQMLNQIDMTLNTLKMLCKYLIKLKIVNSTINMFVKSAVHLGSTKVLPK